MRGQDRPGLKRFPLAGALLGGVLVFVCGAISAPDSRRDRAARNGSRSANGGRAGPTPCATDRR